MDPNATDPNWKTRLSDMNKKVDPWADRVTQAVGKSDYTAGIILGIAVALILFGVWAVW